MTGLRAFDWAGLAALAIFTYKVPGSRGAFGGMAVLFVLFFVQKFLPKLFDSKIFYGLALALPSRWQCSVSTPGMSTTPSGPMSGWRCCC